MDLDWNPGTVLPKGTLVRLDYIRTDSPTPRHANYAFSESTGTWPEFLLGLTGSDWPRADLGIVAYQLTLYDPQGSVLDKRQSFLWALPPSVGRVDPAGLSAAPAAPAVSAPEPGGPR